MPEITLQSKIDRFRVPLLIYSSLLKAPKKFEKTVSHFDVAPSILAYYRNNYQLSTPSSVAWVGKGLRPDSDASVSGIPIMKSKNQLVNYVYGNYHLEDNQLLILSKMQEEPVVDAAERKKIIRKFDDFKSMNARFYLQHKLMPDSVYVNFMKKTKPKF